MEYVVVDNALSPERADEIANSLSTLDFISIANGAIPKGYEWADGVISDETQHLYIIDNTETADFISDIISSDVAKQFLGDRVFMTGKVNKVPPPTEEWQENMYGNPHIDTTFPRVVSGVYYINDADGDTFLFNEKWDEEKPEEVPSELTLMTRVTPLKGRLLLFNGRHYHSAGVPSKDTRYVINMNFGPVIYPTP